MNGKKSLRDLVQEKIETSPYIKFCLGEGLINYSALARRYIPEIEKAEKRKINEESLIVAIKRFADQTIARQKEADYAQVFASMSVGLQEEMAFAAFQKSQQVIDELEKTIEEAEWSLGEVRVMIEDPVTITVLLKKSRVEKLMEKIGGKMLKEYKDYSLISLKQPREANSTYGLISIISSELAKKGISIEIITIPTDIYILF